MRQPRVDSPPPEWRILSTPVRTRDGPRRLEQAFQLLLGPAGPPEGTIPVEGNSDHASSDLRPRLDRPPGA
jgi:hypothetical protein